MKIQDPTTTKTYQFRYNTAGTITIKIETTEEKAEREKAEREKRNAKKKRRSRRRSKKTKN